MYRWPLTSVRAVSVSDVANVTAINYLTAGAAYLTATISVKAIFTLGASVYVTCQTVLAAVTNAVTGEPITHSVNTAS